MTKDPTYLDLAHCSAVPCREFLFGTDTMGRDIFSMIWYGGRLSLFIGVGSTVISTLLAILFGTVSGLAPKWLDALLMRLTEILLSVPNLLLVIFLQAVIGTPSAWSIALVIGLTSWTSIAKVVRTEVQQLRASEYVIAAKCMGDSFFHILRCHLAPNFFSSILFMVVMNVRSAIIAESTLSFMGLGLPIEVVTWGSMLSLAEKALMTDAWWILLIPGAFLVVTLLCITHDIMALERFDPATRHMIVFDVLTHDSPVGWKGEKMRLFLTDAGYSKALENQEKGHIKIRNHAKVLSGDLHYDHKDRER